MNMWHVGVEASVNTDLTAARAAVDWMRRGHHVNEDEVPRRIRPWLRLDVSEPRDLDTEPPRGAFWNGQAQAAEVISACERTLTGYDWRPADKQFPGLGQLEREYSEKIGRLSGVPTGSWCHPSGFFEGAGQTFVGEQVPYEDWLTAMAAWMGGCTRWVGAVLPYRGTGELYFTGTTPVSQREAMDSFDASKHKGWPSHDTGPSKKTITASCKLAGSVLTGAVKFEPLLARMETESRTRCAALQFFRYQAGRKPVPVMTYDAESDGPVERFSIRNRWPKMRSIWAVPTWLNLIMRPATGALYGKLRSSPYHQVLPGAVLGYMAAQSHNKNPWFSEDVSNFDMSVSAAALQALAATLSLEDQRARDAIYYTMGLEILTPSHKPGQTGYRYRRNRAMLSGSTYTAAGDSLINGAACLLAMRDVTGATVQQCMDTLRAGKWGIMISGDDTIIQLPAGIPYEKWAEARGKLGFKVATAPGVNFLAKQYGLGERYTNLVCRLIQNALFREERMVSDSPWVHRLGIVSALALLQAHPNRGLFEKVVRPFVPRDEQDAFGMGPDKIPYLTKRAIADASDREIERIEAQQAQFGPLASSRDGDESPEQPMFDTWDTLLRAEGGRRFRSFREEFSGATTTSVEDAVRHLTSVGNEQARVA